MFRAKLADLVLARVVEANAWLVGQRQLWAIRERRRNVLAANQAEQGQLLLWIRAESEHGSQY
jgi:hypothetical protein